eukprot:NODE_3474_length_970_cov_72.786102_g3189_i0.p3 GENE.NODE_3474_length_970_cov_72.786102_g3189_i0~~NODE_3474_length_970_cov_72.786102_g3189_i0.p3  ORF type:complete len:102 (-),score=6.95 NODE_3474_length_970_cov_72.786102_g3189_i0:454-759(-)
MFFMELDGVDIVPYEDFPSPPMLPSAKDGRRKEPTSAPDREARSSSSARLIPGRGAAWRFPDLSRCAYCGGPLEGMVFMRCDHAYCSEHCMAHFDVSRQQG